MEAYQVGDIVLYRANKDLERHMLILEVIGFGPCYRIYTALHLEEGRVNKGAVFYDIDAPYLTKVA